MAYGVDSIKLVPHSAPFAQAMANGAWLVYELGDALPGSSPEEIAALELLAAEQLAFDAIQAAQTSKEFAAWKEAGGVEKPPSATRSAIRLAAEKLAHIEALDLAVEAVADKAWLVRWEEKGEFTRADLDVLADGKTLSGEALDDIFALALTIAA